MHRLESSQLTSTVAHEPPAAASQKPARHLSSTAQESRSLRQAPRWQASAVQGSASSQSKSARQQAGSAAAAALGPSAQRSPLVHPLPSSQAAPRWRAAGSRRRGRKRRGCRTGRRCQADGSVHARPVGAAAVGRAEISVVAARQGTAAGTGARPVAVREVASPAASPTAIVWGRPVASGGVWQSVTLFSACAAGIVVKRTAASNVMVRELRDGHPSIAGARPAGAAQTGCESRHHAARSPGPRLPRRNTTCELCVSLATLAACQFRLRSILPGGGGCARSSRDAGHPSSCASCSLGPALQRHPPWRAVDLAAAARPPPARARTAGVIAIEPLEHGRRTSLSTHSGRVRSSRSVLASLRRLEHAVDDARRASQPRPRSAGLEHAPASRTPSVSRRGAWSSACRLRRGLAPGYRGPRTFWLILECERVDLCVWDPGLRGWTSLSTPSPSTQWPGSGWAISRSRVSLRGEGRAARPAGGWRGLSRRGGCSSPYAGAAAAGSAIDSPCPFDPSRTATRLRRSLVAEEAVRSRPELCAAEQALPGGADADGARRRLRRHRHQPALRAARVLPRPARGRRHRRQRARRALADLLVADHRRHASSTWSSSCAPTTAARAASCAGCAGGARPRRRHAGRRAVAARCSGSSARRCSTATA